MYTTVSLVEMAQTKFAFAFGGKKVCMQCHRPISPDEKFCSKACSNQYWQEFQDFVFVTSGKEDYEDVPYMQPFRSCCIDLEQGVSMTTVSQSMPQMMHPR